MTRRLVTLVAALAVCALTKVDPVQAGGWSVSDAGATRIGMYAVMGKVNDPTAIFHNVANIATTDGLQVNGSMLAGFATAQFQLQKWDFRTGKPIYDAEGEPVDSETSTPDLNYGAFPYFGMTYDFGLADKGWNFGIATYFPNLTGGSIAEDSEFRYNIVRGFFITNYTSFAVAKKINEQLYVGLSLDSVYALQTAKLYFRIETLAGYDPDTLALLDLVGGLPNGDLKTNLTVGEWKPSYHLSILYKPAPNVSLGVTYFERVDFNLDGDIRLRISDEDYALLGQLQPILGTIPQIINADLEQTMFVPRSIKMGMNFIVNEKWNWGFDVYWWDYSKFQDQTRTITGLPEAVSNLAPGDSAEVVLTGPKLYQDSWQFSLGAEHIVNERWKLRFGVSYDDSPIPNSTFTIDALTSDSMSAAIGFEYQVNERNSFGFGFQHIIFATRSIRDSLTDPPTNGEIITSFTDSVMLEWNYRM